MTIEYDLTLEDYSQYNYYYHLKRNRRKPWIAIILLSCFLFIGLSFLLSKNQNFKNDITKVVNVNVVIFGIVFIIVSFGIRSKYFIKFRVKNLLGNSGNKELVGHRQLLFKEDCLIIFTELSELKYNWSAIIDFVENSNYFFLFRGFQDVIIIPKRVFLLPQEEYDVKSFIERKLAEQKKQS